MRTLTFALLIGCSSPTTPLVVEPDTALVDSAAEADVALDVTGDANKAAACASTFGDKLTNAFGRVDGIVTAVVRPVDTTCPLPNDDHVIIQLRMDGSIYRMVVNVRSTRGTDRRVRTATIEHALLGVPWSPGFHIGIPVDYPTMLDAHSATFTPYEMDPLAAEIADAITIGSKISVFATSSGGSSAHKIHRDDVNSDGAIVLDPDSKPRWMLFAFAEQMF